MLPVAVISFLAFEPDPIAGAGATTSGFQAFMAVVTGRANPDRPAVLFGFGVHLFNLIA